MTFQTILPVEYPETDGRPVGEKTDLHIDWMIRVRDLLKHRYRHHQTYVTANLLVYFEEGDPSRFVVPDIMVVKDCQPDRRRGFKIWEEGRTPNTVFEITSRGTQSEDLRASNRGSTSKSASLNIFSMIPRPNTSARRCKDIG